MNKTKLPFMALAISVGMLISSCKKTEVVPYDAEPANHISAYTVTNAQEVLNGVVDDVDNTITVYMPYYLSIDFIVPEIKLEEGATLIDADGNSVDIREDLEPVPFDTVGYSYRVKDNKNNIRKYTLITKISPHKDPLKLGYATKRDANGNTVADDTTPKDVLVNSRFTIYGNLESSAKNAKLTLINKATNAVVPNALKVIEVIRSTEIHFITAYVSAEVQNGDYYIQVEHQGRKTTLPTIHLNYKKPYFDFLGKTHAVGETVTLNVRGSDQSGNYSGVNTGVSRAYMKLTKRYLVRLPANFPEDLFDKPVELEIVSQTRTQIKVKFPELPLGFYEANISSGGGEAGYILNYTGLGIYFDFNDAAWGKDNLLSSVPNSAFELTAKK
ncbi:hypothetical protein [Pedobacter metabolipauper]|uniref:Uncharacterized protein n=1 Tax=Pedobacter metabolipauper TaxID=425513 RepID=A0A4R6SVW0_9SPHI|nr:hypothetical protein [Pedobacter metabolipauper]TDQ08252.1 hypothetical protein ATK78_2760 [Pedobacter metabolipauper]